MVIMGSVVLMSVAVRGNRLSIGSDSRGRLSLKRYWRLGRLRLDGGRIVVTASNAHRGAALDFGDLQSEHGYSGFPVYCRSKLMNILFTRALARRLDRGITANALHPGFVATRFGDQSGGIMGGMIRLIKPVGAISPEKGAETIVWLAASPDVAGVTGGYFYQCRPEVPTVHAQNDADGERLWKISEEIAARS